MPVSIATARADLRDQLNEITSAFYLDSSLNNWLNEGARDLARRAHALQDEASITVYAGVQNYQAPTSMVQMHRGVYLPEGSLNVYALEIRNYSEMDEVWGNSPLTQQYYPSYMTMWREPPHTNIVLFPVPSSGGVLKLSYYRMALPATSDTMLLDVAEGWQDVVTTYALYKALFKSLDPRWKDMRALYNEQVEDMTMTAAGYADNVGLMTRGNPGGGMWPFGGGDVWY